MQPHYYDGRNANSLMLMTFIGACMALLFVIISGIVTMKKKSDSATVMGILSLMIIFFVLIVSAVFQSNIIKNPHKALSVMHKMRMENEKKKTAHMKHSTPVMAMHQMPRSQSRVM
jgi:hypothetical protein